MCFGCLSGLLISRFSVMAWIDEMGLCIADFPSSGFDWLLTLRHDFAWNVVSWGVGGGVGYCFCRLPEIKIAFLLLNTCIYILWLCCHIIIGAYIVLSISNLFIRLYYHRRIHCIYLHFFQMLLNGHDKYAKSYWRLMLFSGCNFEGSF